MIIFFNSFKSFPAIGLNLPSPLVYSEAVTSVDTVNEDGSLERLVSSPSHIAAYNPGADFDGLYTVTAGDLVGGPQLLYPGEFSLSQPDPGGNLVRDHEAWVVGVGALTLGYRVMLGDSATQLATVFPYDNSSRSAGDILKVLLDATDNNGTKTFTLYEVALAENPLGPLLEDFNPNYADNAIEFNSDSECTITYRRYTLGYEFSNQAAEVLAGTGAIGGGSYDIEFGLNEDPITITGGISGAQEVWIVGQVGSGPISNVIGGPVNLTAGSSLTSPNFRGSSIGGDATNVGVSSAVIPLPAYENGDLVILPIGLDCAANQVAGVTATGPNGEVATVKQALTDNGVVGDSGQSIALLYYRATAANTSGSVTINITAGGAKSAEQIICTPIARFNVKASGDPFAQVVKTSSSTAVSTVSTAALTAVNEASRIEAALISEFDLPPGTPPADLSWTVREVGRYGAQSIQTVSRNAAVTAASESIAAVTFPLSVARAYVGLTWELLPLGA